MADITVTGRFTGGAFWTPKVDPKGVLKHSACIVLDDGQAEKINAVIANVQDEKWAKKPPGLVIYGPREGDDEEYASYGKFFINPKSSTKVPPTAWVKESGRTRQVTEGEGLIYPGCYVAVALDAYALDARPQTPTSPKVSACISLGLGKILFRRHGERLSGGVGADSAFEGFDSDFNELEDDMAF